MNFFGKIYYMILKKINPIKYAKKIGVTLGEGCKLIGTTVWGSEPWLVTIGNHTEISFDCAFITHDGATWVFRDNEKYKDVLKFGRITIGDNCFIGARSTILPDVTIGDRCVVAAGSLVNKSIKSGEVWGGVPARFIKTTEEYAEECLKNNKPYNKENYEKNKRKEVCRVLDKFA